MPVNRHIVIITGILLFSCLQLTAFAQLGFDIDIQKPKPYENRILGAEKTSTKKFSVPRHILQNTFTHYNYVFNARNKLNDVILQAKQAYKDDYASLLPFYNYSLDATAQNKAQLDSVIYKAQTGIVLHDLRNDYIDNLYLLWGAAYYLQQQYDSAYQMFQFINYAFAEKEKDGYYKYIGSHMDGNNVLTIATKEEAKFPKTLISDPPSRNNAFIWQIRTLTQLHQYTAAGSLITTLKNDPNFPERLKSDLEEVQAYWFYQQQMWDSAANHLALALDKAQTQQEKARWEYLIGQLYEKTGKNEIAQTYYTKSIGHTTDPVLDIYARLNLIRTHKDSSDNYIDQNIAQLMKMVKKDKYADYRDVIYYMAAQMEMARNNPLAAQAYILKAAQYSNNNIGSRNESFLQLADMLFDQKKYKPALTFYDSLQTTNLTTIDSARVNTRKTLLTPLVTSMQVVERQDSLQRLAAMPEEERTAFIKKMVRQLRYQRGLKDENAIMPVPVTAGNNTAPDLFGNQSTKGDWYFYNTTLRQQGFATFKQIWGNRPNVDNWRRLSDVTAVLRQNNPNNTRGNPLVTTDPNATPTTESLLSNIPLTPELLQASNDSIKNALYTQGNIYATELDDYENAIATFEELRRRFPQFADMSQVLFQLYYSYTKMGNMAKAAEMKKLLLDNYPTSRYATIITKGIDPASHQPTEAVTRTYEHIYDLFIEGKFAEAEAAKKVADSIYHTNYWSPQLLYIESVYYIRQREDSTAMQLLTTLINQDPGSPLAQKAITLKDVLSRRKQIEEELTNLQIQRPAEDTSTRIAMAPPPKTQEPVVPQEQPKAAPPVAITPPAADTVSVVKENLPAIAKDTTAAQTQQVIAQKPTLQPIDTATKKLLPPVAHKPSSVFTYNTDAPHYALVILNKVDVVFGNEARNAFNRYNGENYYNQPLDIQLLDWNADTKLLLIGNFVNAQAAIDYVQQAKGLAATQIVPWLKGDKYSFSIISNQNLEALKTHPDLKAYEQFLAQNLPVKF